MNGVVEASSVSVKSMSDGTLRVSVDVEPRHSQAAYALFMPPGVPMALAALKTAAAPPPPPKGGELSKWVAMRCDEPPFQRFIIDQAIQAVPGSALAAVLVRAICDVSSRAEIDNDPAARARFEDRIRGPWMMRQEQT